MPYQYEANKLVYLVVPILITALSLLSVLLRCWIRLVVVKNFRIDDWLLVFSQACGIFLCVFWVLIREREQYYEPESPELLRNLSWMLLTCEVTYLLSSTVLKVSCGLTLLRITNARWQRILFITAMALHGIITTIAAVGFITRCEDVDPVILETSNSCKRNFDDFIGPIGHATAASNAFCDWTFALVPLYITYSTRRRILERTSQRVSIGIVGAFGIGGSVISLVRLVSLDDLRFGTRIFDKLALPFMLVILETGVCSTAVSMLAMRPLQDQLKTWKLKLSRYSHTPAALRIPSSAPMRIHVGRLDTTSPSKKTVSDPNFHLADITAVRQLGMLPDTIDMESQRGDRS